MVVAAVWWAGWWAGWWARCRTCEEGRCLAGAARFARGGVMCPGIKESVTRSAAPRHLLLILLPFSRREPRWGAGALGRWCRSARNGSEPRGEGEE